VINKKTDEERKAKKEDKERKKISVKAIDIMIRVTNPVNCRGKMTRVYIRFCRYNRTVSYLMFYIDINNENSIKKLWNL